MDNPIYKVRADINPCLLQSVNAFDDGTYWVTQNGTISGDQGLSPTGLLQSDVFLDNTIPALHGIYQNITSATGHYARKGQWYNFSVYAKAHEDNNFDATLSEIVLTILEAPQTARFNIKSGTSLSTPNAANGLLSTSVTSAPYGYYRISAILSPTTINSANQFYIYAGDGGSYAGSGTNLFYLWGAQLTPTEKLYPFVPPANSVAAAEVGSTYYNIAADTERVSISRDLATFWNGLREGRAQIQLQNETGIYSPNNPNGAYYGQLALNKKVEIQAQNANMLKWSEVFSGGGWVWNTVNGLPTGYRDPMNTNKAVRMITLANTDSNNLGIVAVLPNIAVKGDRTYFSIYAAQADNYVDALSIVSPGQVQSGGSNSWPWAKYNLNVGSVYATNPVTATTSLEATMTRCANGFWLCTLGITTVTSIGNNLLYIRNVKVGYSTFSGDGLSGIYIYGAQVSSGSLYNYIRTESISNPTYNLFTGRIRDISINPHPDALSTTLECVDDVGELNNKLITTSLYSAYNPTSLFTSIYSLSEVGSFNVQSIAQDQTMFAWWRNEKPAKAINDLIEYGYYVVYVDGVGTHRALNRDYDQKAPIANYTRYYSFDTELGYNHVVNDFRIKSQPRRFSTTVQTVAYIDNPITLTASAWTSYWIDYLDPNTGERNTPANSLVSLVASTDYYMATNSDGTGADLTSQHSIYITTYGATAVVSIYNGGATAYLTRFQIRGLSAQRIADIALQSQQTSSQAIYGKRGMEVVNNLITYQHATSYGQFILDTFADPFSDPTIGLRNVFPDVMERELADIITVVESNTYINDNYTIIGVDHDIEWSSGRTHTTRYNLFKQEDFKYLYLNDPVKGQIDSDRKLAF